MAKDSKAGGKKAKPASSKKSTKGKKRGGQKGNKNAKKYDSKYEGVVKEVYMLGGGPQEASAACGLTLRTLYNWLKTQPEIAAAAQEGEQWFDDNAEVIYRRGLMLEATPHDETTEREGPEGLVKITKKGQFNLKGLADYLRRKRPDKYGDKHKHEIGASDDVKSMLDWLAERNDGDTD